MNSSTILISLDGLAGFYLDLPQLQLPNLRTLIKRGTFARRLTITYPTSTWISHTSAITGCFPAKHGVLGNWTIDRARRSVIEHFGDQTNKESVVAVPTLYDVAKQAGLTTAALMWPVTRGARSLDFCIPPFYQQQMYTAHVDPGFWQALRDAQFTIDRYAAWSVNHGLGGGQDWLTLQIGEYLLETKRPELLMLHFLLPDSLQHDYGVHSPEAYYAMEHCDLLLGRLLNKLDTLGLREQTNIVVFSDHGHAPIDREVRPNVVLQQRGWQQRGDDMNRPSVDGELRLSDETKVAAVTNGGDGYLYIFAEGEERAALAREAQAALMETEAFDAILGPEHFAQLGLPRDHKDTPDYVLCAKPGYFVSHLASAASGESPLSGMWSGENGAITPAKFKSMHGYRPSMPEMDGFAVFSGPSYATGATIERMHLTDIAPTIAHTLNLELPDADGHRIPVES
jgi:predicted AlkP superfamily pyrophosphatase or phosphodiesterase